MEALKTSELIKSLQDHQAAFGDLPVMFGYQGAGLGDDENTPQPVAGTFVQHDINKKPLYVGIADDETMDIII